MEVSLTTPALLFPAISLLLLAYTNRFLTIANLIRGLHDKYLNNPERIIMGQIKNLRRRVILIKNMQVFGIASLLLCVVCMFIIFAGWQTLGSALFGVSLILLMISLGLSLVEIQISVKALNIHLSDLDEFDKNQKGK
ncbi:MAG: DUF2721 domain-containing protein [Cyclobacteriaceae bacterium]|nr:DUF2721 domain-containing protein [Cyclobacteriaceae bacterium]MCH8516767.1 DUF2721 domain-containing protein [Cyclobacteriaceae bacterium]